ncbi:hypothetical protein BDW69DRAFT_165490 [Aspergillus filifer]
MDSVPVGLWGRGTLTLSPTVFGMADDVVSMFRKSRSIRPGEESLIVVGRSEYARSTSSEISTGILLCLVFFLYRADVPIELFFAPYFGFALVFGISCSLQHGQMKFNMTLS